MFKSIWNQIWDSRVIAAIARVTFFEIIRDKVLYNTLLCALLLLCVGALAAKLAVFNPTRVLIDFGLTAVSLSCVLVSIFSTAPMIAREFDRRTIFVALARPITRSQFILGKYAGLALVLISNWFLMVLVYSAIIFVQAGAEGFSWLSLTWFYALILVLLQSLVIAAVTLCFSTYSTPALSVIFTIGMLVVGKNISQIRWLASKAESPFFATVLNMASYLFPNFEHFDLAEKVTYGLPVRFAFFGFAVIYSLLLIVLPLALGSLFLHRRES